MSEAKYEVPGGMLAAACGAGTTLSVREGELLSARLEAALAWQAENPPEFDTAAIQRVAGAYEAPGRSYTDALRNAARVAFSLAYLIEEVTLPDEVIKLNGELQHKLSQVDTKELAEYTRKVFEAGRAAAKP